MSEIKHSIEVLGLAENCYYLGASLLEHKHMEYHQIYFIKEGSATFLVNGEAHVMHENMFLMAHPGVVHGISEVSESSVEPALSMLEAKFVVFNSELAADLLKLPLVCQGTPKLRELFDEAFLEGVQKDECYENTVTCLISYFLYLTIRINRNYILDSVDEKLQPKVTTLVKEYISQNYAQEVSLDTLADLTGYSKTYLCRIFHKNTGVTINTYLNKVRISNAAQLLAATDMDLMDVGRATGYNSVFHFIKTFKKMVGVPPGMYRKSELVGGDLVNGTVVGINSVIRAEGAQKNLIENIR